MEIIKEIKATELYEKYRNWCNQNGERNIITNTKFGMMIKDKLVKKHSRTGNVYVLEE